jgi:flagellar export protein FliJ
MADGLQTLLRLRRLALDQARSGLADCLHAEAEASATVRTIANDIQRETDLVCRAQGDDRIVEVFSAWLRRVRISQQAAANALLTAETHTLEARSVLVAGRIAVETVEALIAQRQAEQVAAERQQDQKLLDETGRSRSGHPP